MNVLKNKVIAVAIFALLAAGAASVYVSRANAGPPSGDQKLTTLGVYPWMDGRMKVSYIERSVTEKHGVMQVLTVLNFSKPMSLPGNFHPDGAVVTFAIDCANSRANKIQTMFVNTESNDMRDMNLNRWYPITGSGVESDLASKVC